MSGHPDPERLEALAGIGQVAGAPGADAEAASHVAICAECAREVALLRKEQALLSRRAAVVDARPDRDAMWSAISARLPAAGASSGMTAAEEQVAAPVVELAGRREVRFSPQRRWARRALGTASVALAAAAVVLLSVQRPGQVSVLAGGALDAAVPGELAEGDGAASDPRVKSALDRAEADYAGAAQVLEGEVLARQAALDTADPDGSRKLGASLKSARARLDAARAVAEDDPEARVRVLGGYARYVRSLQQTIRQSEENAP